MNDTRLLLVLGDQLSPSIAALQGGRRDRDVVLMAEVSDETRYVAHHKKKIAFILSAMRHFACSLEADGWTVDYVRLDAPGNTGSFTGEVERALARHGSRRIVVTEPGEWRVLREVESWGDRFAVALDIRADDRFVCAHDAFAAWSGGRRQLRMEYFYREMRRNTGLLMDGDKPVGGRWNFDAENRKPPDAGMATARPKRFAPDGITSEVLDLVGDRFSAHFGTLTPFWFAVTASDAEAALDHFVAHALPRFGDYQDAMLAGEPFLYHSVLSVYMNAGLLDPVEVCRRAEAAYRSGAVPLNAAEGFIRQIIGWREFVRGVYWLHMPDYGTQNALDATRDLPAFYWSGETEMACVKAAVVQTRDEAYAHHIQRLMVTGNFAMLAGVDPRQVHEWYLAVYADAFEWVELPNTLGMSQYADGGVLASKPYAASGNYINKMSDYCGTCRYDVKQKTGDNACPFNSLYWDFLARNEDRLRGNPRLAHPYRTWDRMSAGKRAEYRLSAARFLGAL